MTEGNNSRLHGTVARKVDARGFGFITVPSDNSQYFFHKSELENVSFEQLSNGDLVSFEPLTSPKGPRAEQVRKIDGLDQRLPHERTMTPSRQHKR